MDQGQHRVIIFVYFVELESPELHANFQDDRTIGPGEEDLYLYLPNLNRSGCGGLIGHVTWNIYAFCPLSSGGSRQKLALIGLAVSESMFETYGHIAPGRDRHPPWSKNDVTNINLLSIWSFAVFYFPLNDFVTVYFSILCDQI